MVWEATDRDQRGHHVETPLWPRLAGDGSAGALDASPRLSIQTYEREKCHRRIDRAPERGSRGRSRHIVKRLHDVAMHSNRQPRPTLAASRRSFLARGRERPGCFVPYDDTVSW